MTLVFELPFPSLENAEFPNTATVCSIPLKCSLITQNTPSSKICYSFVLSNPINLLVSK